MNCKRLASPLIFLAAALFALVQQPAFADTVTNVTVNTSGLGATPGSEIYFILTDGSGTGDANNTATLTNFALGGGIAGAVDTLNSSGGITGNLTSGVTLVDNSFLSAFGQLFTAGNTLSFSLDLTSNVDAGSTPDQFSMLILDPSGNPLPNSDPLGFGNLLVINIDSANPTILNYAPGLVTFGSAPPPPPPPPPPPVTTPEPSTLLLLGSALIAFVAFFGRRSLTLRIP
ncbi:MAG TPA: NF038129 family PEP-CTERM protein [Candidatus Dormibacteraeota bacterium]|nr:NF038129 family PEP-CTERM protein [Candidatus Dormibacteraeota bacterium]